MSQFVLDMNNCPMCASTGPALLPARYAVVTDNIPSGLHGWAIPQQSFPQVAGYHYALRALRQGFVYVFYEISQQWDTWAVCEDGSLWKQRSPAYAKAKKTSDCTAPQHSATNMEMLILREDALRGDCWLAFSPSKWSVVTVERYTRQAELREKRMQCLAYWQWSEPENAEGVAAASPGSLENILDYAPMRPSHASFQLPYNPAIPRISQTEPAAPWYSFEKGAVKPLGTLYPWSTQRAGCARRTLQALQTRGQGVNRYGKPITPLVMAIHDPIGIAHELTGFGDDITMLHKNFREELSIEFMTEQALNAAKNQIKLLRNTKAFRKTEDRLEFNQDAMNKHARYGYGLSKKDRELWREREHLREFLNSEKEVAYDWEKYAGKLNQQKLQAFHDCNQAFNELLAQELEALAILRVKWLQEPLFIIYAQDFYSSFVEDNLNYREAVDYGFASLNLTPTGTAFLDMLIDQYSTHDEGNLVWRSLMLNNPEIMEETRPFLQGMAQHKDNHNKADENIYQVLMTKLGSKFAKAYVKANDILDKNPQSTASWARRMLAADRRMTTLGDRFFNYTRLGKSLDTANELLSKGLFTVAAGISTVGKEVERGVVQLVSADAARQEILKSLKAKATDTEGKSLRNNYLKQFNDFANSSEGLSELKKSRLKLLMLMFNVLEYSFLIDKLEQDYNNKKTIVTLLAVVFGSVNIAADIIMPSVEYGLKIAPLINTLKWIGNGAGAISSVLMLAIDFADGVKESNGQRRWLYIGLSGGKVLFDLAVATKALGMLLDFAQKRGVVFASNVISERLIALAAWKIIGIAASWYVMIGLFLIEKLFNYYYDNELDKWCRASVFGEDPAEELISTERISLSEIRIKIQNKQEENFQMAVKVI